MSAYWQSIDEICFGMDFTQEQKNLISEEDKYIIPSSTDPCSTVPSVQDFDKETVNVLFQNTQFQAMSAFVQYNIV